PVVEVPPKLSARVRVLSSFASNARKNDGLDALATALWPPRVTSGWRRLILRPARRYCACFPRGAKIWEPSAPERAGEHPLRLRRHAGGGRRPEVLRGPLLAHAQP